MTSGVQLQVISIYCYDCSIETQLQEPNPTDLQVLEGISKRVEVLPANEESLPDIEAGLGWAATT